MKNSFYTIICLIVFASCTSYDDMITEWFFTSDEQESWLVDSTLKRFEMMDQNGITREFVRSENGHYFLSGSSLFAGLKYHKSQREYYYQRYRSNYGDQYYFDIQASFDNEITGGDFLLHLNNLNFSYDYLYNEITRLEIRDTSEWLSITSDGIEDPLFNSTLDFFENYKIGEKVYDRVFHFQLNDFENKWNKHTITDVYYAQKIGLLSYKLNNGLIFERKLPE